MNHSKYFPLDRMRYFDLEPLRVSETEITFSKGYYYQAYIKAGEILEFKGIKNSFIIGKDKITKKFILKEDSVKHFYFKVTLGEKIKTMTDASELDEENVDDIHIYAYPVLEDLYDIASVEITDEVITSEGDHGFPFCEKTELVSNESGEYYTSLAVGPFLKEDSKIFYVYFCSLRLGDGDDQDLSTSAKSISSWRYYHPKDSDDPSLKGPFKHKVFLDIIDDEREQRLFEELKIYDNEGNPLSGDELDNAKASSNSFLYSGIHYKTKRHDVLFREANINGYFSYGICNSPLSFIGRKVKMRDLKKPPPPEEE